MDRDGSGLPDRSAWLRRRMPRHRISRASVLHRDPVSAATIVHRQEATSASHGLRSGRRELVSQETRRLHPGLSRCGTDTPVRHYYFPTANTTKVSGSTFLSGSTFAVTVNNSCVFGSSAIVRAWS